ncbi:hypothetical protein [Streptomyces caniscabiei]|uniref:Uncharacterized protein n=1 Tax=Streptomyces caniscabiei TaxID=2746961 RepID=A0ABU4MIF0_9ACTN|nr:hypothetical protein [Streptomyces caniscabiei]MBE4790976.1 hypothetical protein [Streptomyces caniscabiei]MDX3009603.1 hypothetical protein [Streptomyces caniscabiei]MDX3037248.1 hypothetical protein [Streptomyces caniscabiei]
MPKSRVRRHRRRPPEQPHTELVPFLRDHYGMTRAEARAVARIGAALLAEHTGPLMARFACDYCHTYQGPAYDAMNTAQLNAARADARAHMTACPGRI